MLGFGRSCVSVFSRARASAFFCPKIGQNCRVFCGGKKTLTKIRKRRVTFLVLNICMFWWLLLEAVLERSHSGVARSAPLFFVFVLSGVFPLKLCESNFSCGNFSPKENDRVQKDGSVGTRDMNERTLGNWRTGTMVPASLCFYRHLGDTTECPMSNEGRKSWSVDWLR